MPKDLMNVEEAAAFLRHSKLTLNRWRSSGTGPRFIRAGEPGARILYRLADLQSWLDLRTVDPKNEG